jgi:hypothetical protein
MENSNCFSETGLPFTIKTRNTAALEMTNNRTWDIAKTALFFAAFFIFALALTTLKPGIATIPDTPTPGINFMLVSSISTYNKADEFSTCSDSACSVPGDAGHSCDNSPYGLPAISTGDIVTYSTIPKPMYIRLEFAEGDGIWGSPYALPSCNFTKYRYNVSCWVENGSAAIDGTYYDVFTVTNTTGGAGGLASCQPSGSDECMSQKVINGNPYGAWTVAANITFNQTGCNRLFCYVGCDVDNETGYAADIKYGQTLAYFIVAPSKEYIHYEGENTEFNDGFTSWNPVASDNGTWTNMTLSSTNSDNVIKNTIYGTTPYSFSSRYTKISQTTPDFYLSSTQPWYKNYTTDWQTDSGWETLHGSECYFWETAIVGNDANHNIFQIAMLNAINNTPLITPFTDQSYASMTGNIFAENSDSCVSSGSLHNWTEYSGNTTAAYTHSRSILHGNFYSSIDGYVPTHDTPFINTLDSAFILEAQFGTITASSQYQDIHHLWTYYYAPAGTENNTYAISFYYPQTGVTYNNTVPINFTVNTSSYFDADTWTCALQLYNATGSMVNITTLSTVASNTETETSYSKQPFIANGWYYIVGQCQSNEHPAFTTQVKASPTFYFTGSQYSGPPYFDTLHPICGSTQPVNALHLDYTVVTNTTFYGDTWNCTPELWQYTAPSTYTLKKRFLPNETLSGNWSNMYLDASGSATDGTNYYFSMNTCASLDVPAEILSPPNTDTCFFDIGSATNYTPYVSYTLPPTSATYNNIIPTAFTVVTNSTFSGMTWACSTSLYNSSGFVQVLSGYTCPTSNLLHNATYDLSSKAAGVYWLVGHCARSPVSACGSMTAPYVNAVAGTSNTFTLTVGASADSYNVTYDRSYCGNDSAHDTTNVPIIFTVNTGSTYASDWWSCGVELWNSSGMQYDHGTYTVHSNVQESHVNTYTDIASGWYQYVIRDCQSNTHPTLPPAASNTTCLFGINSAGTCDSTCAVNKTQNPFPDCSCVCIETTCAPGSYQDTDTCLCVAGAPPGNGTTISYKTHYDCTAGQTPTECFITNFPKDLTDFLIAWWFPLFVLLIFGGLFAAVVMNRRV